MPQKITTFRNRRKHSQRVDLDGVTYRLVLTWRQRVKGWYMDLYTGGEAIALGRRISAKWSPVETASDARLPPGVFVVRGVDGYERTDLGDDLELIYISEADLLALDIPAEETATVTL